MRAFMAGNDYRSGRKRVELLLSGVLHAQVRRCSSDAGLSMSEWLAEAVREKVMRDGDSGVGPGSGVPASSERGFDRDVSERVGEGDAGVEFGDVADSVTFMDEWMSGRAAGVSP